MSLWMYNNNRALNLSSFMVLRDARLTYLRSEFPRSTPLEVTGVSSIKNKILVTFGNMSMLDLLSDKADDMQSGLSPPAEDHCLFQSSTSCGKMFGDEIKCFNSDLQEVASGSIKCQSKNVTRRNGVCNLTCGNDLYPSPFNRAVCGAESVENVGEWYPKNLSCHQIEYTDWNEWSGNEYKLISTQQSWDKSLQTCANNTAHLVAVESKEEDEFVQKLVKNCTTKGTWIGLRFNETNGTWEWSDDTDAVFRNWGGSKPPSGGQGYCVYIDINARRWFELLCNSLRQAVCRRKQ